LELELEGCEKRLEFVDRDELELEEFELELEFVSTNTPGPTGIKGILL
jgi:hypothetical protein